MTRVSVIIAAYNAEASIQECVESLLEVVTPSDEIVVCDDGSTDRTMLVLQGLAENDERIRILRNSKNLGRARARNSAIKISKGKYLAICDADDKALPDFLRPVEVLELDSKVVMASSQVLFESRNLGFWLLKKYPLSPNAIRLEYNTNQNPMSHGGTVIRKSAAIKSGLYNEKYVRAQDLDFLKRLSALGPAYNLTSFGLLYRHNVFLKYSYWKMSKINANRINMKQELQGTSIIHWSVSMAKRLRVGLYSSKEANEIAKRLGLK